MKTVYAREPMPERVTQSIFLAGPTPRSDKAQGWRKEALRILEAMNFEGHVFVPEPRDGVWLKDYEGQVQWEEDGLNLADCIVFWLPRDIEGGMPALTTNDEWGFWKDSGKVVFGAPPSAVKVDYQKHYAEKLKIPCQKTLLDTLQLAVDKVTPGAVRRLGETNVPLYIWNLPSFQSWYKTQVEAGNVLESATVLWTSRFGKDRSKIFLWVLHVEVWIKAEGRSKTNEIVLGRPDISTVVLWHRGLTLASTEVVLIKEFRSPVRTPDAYIRELPGGSAKQEQDPLLTAVEEVHEEANFTIEPQRLKPHTFRQLFGTLSSVGAYVYSAEITDEECERLRAMAGEVHGVESESERTYVEVRTIQDIMDDQLTDWSTMGAIFAGLYEAMR
jgi:8-oxo-dGTP pyrophosphatase MutT (NUDIX family)